MSWYGPLLKRAVWPLILGREGRASALVHERRFRESQHWPIERLREHQLGRLRRLASLAYERSAHYRAVFEERGLRPDSIESLDDLALLPRLRRATLFERAEELLTHLHPPNRVTKFVTGGTSIRAATLYRDQESFNEKLGLAMRHEAWAGRPPGGRMAHVWPALSDIAVDQRWYSRFKERRLLATCMLYAGRSDPESLDRIADAFIGFRPELVKAFPNALGALVDHLRSTGRELPSPRGLISTGEPLHPARRADFSEYFDCPVHDVYASREVGNTAAECEAHDGLHVAMETSIVEFVDEDDRPVPQGETGAILVTDLTNTAFPLIRYEIGDVGRSLAGTCACGRELERMASAVGRVADRVYRMDGTPIEGHVFGVHILTRDDIGEAQVVQRDLGDVLVRLTRSPEPSGDALDDLRTRIREHLGAAVRVSFELVDRIEPEPSGKRRYVKCEMRAQESAVERR